MSAATDTPRLIVPDPGWTPGPAATHELGKFQVDDVGTLTTSWSEAGPDGEQSDDTLTIALRSGVWTATLVVQEEGAPAELAAELKKHADGDYLTCVFETIYRRPWLVVAHEESKAGVPQPGPNPSVELLLRADQWQADSTEAVPLYIGASRLSCVGRLEPWQHRIAFLSSAFTDSGQGAALRSSAAHLACSWDWGCVFRCGRYGLLPVFAIEADSGITTIALPGAIA